MASNRSKARPPSNTTPANVEQGTDHSNAERGQANDDARAARSNGPDATPVSEISVDRCPPTVLACQRMSAFPSLASYTQR
jgi:hypothetical protein